MPSIICLSGPRKAGKTFCADIICGLDSRFQKVAFAGILKDHYAKVKGIDRTLLDDVIQKEKHRRSLQVEGDKARAKNPYVFADGLVNTLDPAGFYVVEDTRYIEELEVLIKLGTKPYGVYADPTTRKSRGWVPDPEVDNHMSELELGSLNSHTWHCLGGGFIYNTKDRAYVEEQLSYVLKKHFPYQIKDLALLGKKK